MFYLVYIGRSCFREQGSEFGIESKGEVMKLVFVMIVFTPMMLDA